MNNSKNIKKSELEKIKNAAEFWPEQYSIFEKITLLEYSSQNRKLDEFKRNLRILRDEYFAAQSNRMSLFEYDKSPGFIHQQIKKTIFRSARSLYPNFIPEDVAELILEIVTPISGEVDLQIKAKNASMSSPNLILSPQTGLKLRTELDYISLSLLDPFKENFYAFADNDYIMPTNSKSSDLGFSFIRMLNGMRYSYQTALVQRT